MTRVFLSIMVIAFLFLAACGGDGSTAEPSKITEPAKTTAPAKTSPITPEVTVSPEPTAEKTVTPEPATTPASTETIETSYNFGECNYITTAEIAGVIGTEYLQGPIAATDPEGCAITFLAKDTQSNFFFLVKHYPSAAEAEKRMVDNDCMEIGSAVKAEITNEVGDLSCRRTYMTKQKDIFFVKGSYLVQVGCNREGVTHEQMLELAKLVEPRI